MPNLHNMKVFYDSDIAMMEHEIIGENEVLEWRPEDAQWYIAGVHAFAQMMIDKIRGEGDV